MRRRDRTRCIGAMLVAGVAVLSGADVATAAPELGREVSPTRPDALKFVGRRRPPRRAARISAVQRTRQRRVPPSPPDKQLVDPEHASTSKLHLQAGAAKVWHKGGIYTANGTGWVSLDFEGVGGKNVAARCNVSALKDGVELKIERPGSTQTQTLGKGVHDIEINIPNAPDTLTATMTTATIPGVPSDATTFIVYFCDLQLL